MRWVIPNIEYVDKRHYITGVMYLYIDMYLGTGVFYIYISVSVACETPVMSLVYIFYVRYNSPDTISYSFYNAYFRYTP